MCICMEPTSQTAKLDGLSGTFHYSLNDLHNYKLLKVANKGMREQWNIVSIVNSPVTQLTLFPAKLLKY